MTTGDGRHLLLADADGYHQVWFVGGHHARGSSFIIPRDDDRAARMHAIQRFERRLAGERSGPLMRSLQLSVHQRSRFTLQLRALDGVRDGASRREIAAVAAACAHVGFEPGQDCSREDVRQATMVQGEHLEATRTVVPPLPVAPNTTNLTAIAGLLMVSCFTVRP